MFLKMVNMSVKMAVNAKVAVTVTVTVTAQAMTKAKMMMICSWFSERGTSALSKRKQRNFYYPLHMETAKLGTSTLINADAMGPGTLHQYPHWWYLTVCGHICAKVCKLQAWHPSQAGDVKPPEFPPPKYFW